MGGALEKGALPLATRERIALAVAEISGSSYCLSAHSYLGKDRAKLDDAEIVASRAGSSSDSKANVAVEFAERITRERGQVSEADVRALKASGYDDGQVIELVQQVALNIFTNYLNLVAATDIDFPVITARKAAWAWPFSRARRASGEPQPGLANLERFISHRHVWQASRQRSLGQVPLEKSAGAQPDAQGFKSSEAIQLLSHLSRDANPYHFEERMAGEWPGKVG